MKGTRLSASRMRWKGSGVMGNLMREECGLLSNVAKDEPKEIGFNRTLADVRFHQSSLCSRSGRRSSNCSGGTGVVGAFVRLAGTLHGNLTETTSKRRRRTGRTTKTKRRSRKRKRRKTGKRTAAVAALVGEE